MSESAADPISHRIANLDTQIWKTKGARFNASRRLMLNHYWSSAAIAFLSVYVVIASVVILMPGAADSSRWSVGTLSVSIAILVFSLLEATRAYQLRADRLHRCGMQLNEVYSELQAVRSKGGSDQEVALTNVVGRYHRILASYEDNHAPIDYQLFMTEHPDHFRLSWLRVKIIRMKWLIRAAGLYLMSIVIPVVAFALWV